MAKTFEALIKAAREKRMHAQYDGTFYLQPDRKIPRASFTREPIPYIAEEYHRMRHNLLSVSAREKIKLIQFSAVNQGEGNSTAIVNFGVTLATGGESVLMVDADFRTPSLHESFALERNKGLTELLREEISLNDAVKKTKIAKLSIVTSGNQHTNPSTLFKSQQLPSLLDQMRAWADWVLFDSPSINTYNDSIVLASLVDGVVMVIEAEKTRWEVAQNAKVRMEEAKAKLLGVILNRRKLHIPERIYNML